MGKTQTPMEITQDQTQACSNNEPDGSKDNHGRSRAPLDSDGIVKEWVRDQVIPAAIALKADPAMAIPISQVREYMTAKRQQRGIGSR